MKIVSYGITDIGKKRTRNEDCFLINDEIRLCLLADGMGGHSGGEFASKMAVTSIEEVVQNMVTDPEATVISGVNSEDTDNGDRLRYAIKVASSKIYDRALYDPSLKGMGTTIVASLFSDGRVHIANVGDSRAYLIHANKIQQVTKDHSLVSEQLQAGVIDEKDFKKHKLKNIITRSVGYQEEVETDVKEYELHMGDKILLCSDGLSNMVDDDEIEKIVVELPVKEACQKLIGRANEKGGEDNITVLLTEITDPVGN